MAPQYDDNKIRVKKLDRSLDKGFLGMYKNYFALLLSGLSFLAAFSFCSSAWRAEEINPPHLIWSLVLALLSVFNGVVMIWEYGALKKKNLVQAEQAYTGMKYILLSLVCLVLPFQYYFQIELQAFMISMGMTAAYAFGIFANGQKVVDLLSEREELLSSEY